MKCKTFGLQITNVSFHVFCAFFFFFFFQSVFINLFNDLGIILQNQL